MARFLEVQIVPSLLIDDCQLMAAAARTESGGFCCQVPPNPA